MRRNDSSSTSAPVESSVRKLPGPNTLAFTIARVTCAGDRLMRRCNTYVCQSRSIVASTSSGCFVPPHGRQRVLRARGEKSNARRTPCERGLTTRPSVVARAVGAGDHFHDVIVGVVEVDAPAAVVVI